MSSILRFARGLVAQQTAPTPSVSYGASRQDLLRQARQGYQLDVQGTRKALEGRMQLGLALRQLKQDVEDNEGPGHWLQLLKQELPEVRERYAQRCMAFSHTDGSEEEWDRICGRSVKVSEEQSGQPNPQPPRQTAQTEGSGPPANPTESTPAPVTPPPPTPLGNNPAPPLGVRQDRPEQSGQPGRGPHSPELGLPPQEPREDDRPLVTSGSLTVGDFEFSYHCPRVASAAEIGAALRQAAEEWEKTHPAPF